MTKFFAYPDEAMDYLAKRDTTLAQVIAQVGRVERTVDDDVFSSIVNSIIGQQISAVAQRTIIARLGERVGATTPDAIDTLSEDELQALGMTFCKASYIKDVARKVAGGEFDLGALEQMSDEDAIATLSSLKGIGRWTAEMTLLFSMGRQDILAFDDLGIQRGMRMTYHHRKITKQLFKKYRRRYSPYGSVASLYLWEVAHGTVEGFQKDFAPKKK